MTPHQRNADYPGDEQLLSPHLAEGFAKGLLVQDAQVAGTMMNGIQETAHWPSG